MSSVSGANGWLDTYRDEVDRLEATLEPEVDGEPLGFRMLRPAIANEPDRTRRERLEQARRDLADEHLNPLYEQAAGLRRDGVQTLGFSTYRDLYQRFDFPLDTLGGQRHTFLAETEDLYVESLDRLFQSRLGLRLDDAQRWDVPRLFRAPEWDGGFPPARCWP